jgi:hypothetical protein
MADIDSKNRGPFPGRPCLTRIVLGTSPVFASQQLHAQVPVSRPARLWIHPFVNVDTDTFAEHRSDGLLVRDRSGNAGLIKWWQGVAAVWDFTNPFAASAFRSRLVHLQALNLMAAMSISPHETCVEPKTSQPLSMLTFTTGKPPPILPGMKPVSAFIRSRWVTVLSIGIEVNFSLLEIIKVPSQAFFS